MNKEEKHLLKIAKEVAFDDYTIAIALEQMQATYKHYIKEAEENDDKRLIRLNKNMLKAIEKAIEANLKIQEITNISP